MARASHSVRRRLLGGLALCVLLLVLSLAWIVPQQFDWTRYRGTIEEIASNQLGRPVRIEGGIGLSLLPEPVLTADRVAIAAPGSLPGISLDVRALRLRVAVAPLLLGRVVPRALVLRQPELRVPWPLPEAARLHTGDWPGAFAARIEQGRLVIGRLVVQGVDGEVATAADGSLSVSGTAVSSELPWRATARLGPADEAGTHNLALALDGQGRAAGLGGAFAGSIAADAAIAGRMTARGPDLSRLLPAPAIPFKAEGPLRIAAGRVSAEEMTLTLGGSPAQARATLLLRPAERLDIALSTGRLDFDQWTRVLQPAAMWFGGWTIPTGIEIAAEAATLGDGTLRRVRLALDIGEGRATLRGLEALLPGEAALHANGRLAFCATGPCFDGTAQLEAPDLRTTAAWVAALGGDRLVAADLPRAGTITGHATAGGGELTLSGITGQLGGSDVRGSFVWRPAGASRIDADLSLDRLALDPFLAGRALDPAALPGILPGHVRLAVRQARLRGLAIDDFVLDAADAEGALALRELSGTVQGVRVAASGTVGAGGRIAEGRLGVAADDARPVAALLPSEWRATQALWRGPLALQATAEGPPDALATRISLDLADARLEALPVLDLPRRSWSGPATLRHPGAGRLLAALGFGEAAEWVGDGSLSAAGQFSGRPGMLAADRFDLTAGLLRAGGQLSLASGDSGRRLTGRIAAETLPVKAPLPGDREPLRLDGLRGWSAAVRIEAGSLFAAMAPDRTLRQVDTVVTIDGGRLRLDPFKARLGGGELQGAAELDASGDIPVVALDGWFAGVDVAGPATGWPVDVASGQGDADFRLRGEGHSPAAVVATASGEAHVALRDGVLDGLDLPAARAALADAATEHAGATEAGIRASLGGGTTPFRTLSATATIANGVATLANASLDGPAGTVDFAGTIGFPAGATGPMLDIVATLRPELASPATRDAARPPIGLRLAGPAATARRTPELAVLAQWLAERAIP